MLKLPTVKNGSIISEGENHGSRRVLLEQGMRSWEQYVPKQPEGF